MIKWPTGTDAFPYWSLILKNKVQYTVLLQLIHDWLQCHIQSSLNHYNVARVDHLERHWVQSLQESRETITVMIYKRSSAPFDTGTGNKSLIEKCVSTKSQTVKKSSTLPSNNTVWIIPKYIWVIQLFWPIFYVESISNKQNSFCTLILYIYNYSNAQLNGTCYFVAITKCCLLFVNRYLQYLREGLKQTASKDSWETGNVLLITKKVRKPGQKTVHW